MVEVNLKSAYRLTRLVAPGMCAARLGLDYQHRVHRRLRPQFHGLLYSMTKAALIMMTQSYAVELGPHGRARECDRAGPDPDRAERILLEG